MLLSEFVTSYVASQPAGIVLDQPAIERSLKDAVRFYCGYATLRAHDPLEVDRDDVPVPHTAIDASNSIAGAQDFDLTASEYALIRPLFTLYVERENAMHLEASRALGVDVYGRSVSEIAQEIRQLETELPRAAFMEPIITVI